ncbi:unnamed protein product, partial [Rotaria sp. Silwood1]
RIIVLSLAHQIVSPYTAFVGVETTTNQSDVTAPPEVRHVPIQISNDDGHLFFHHAQYFASARSFMSDLAFLDDFSDEPVIIQ